MKYIQTAFMVILLFFVSACVKKALVSEKPRGIHVGDEMPQFDGFFKPLPGVVTECNGRVITIRVYPTHGFAKAVSFHRYKQSAPYLVIWFTLKVFEDFDGDGRIDAITSTPPADLACLKPKSWQNKPSPPGLEGVH